MRITRWSALALTMVATTTLVVAAPAPAHADHAKRQAELQKLISKRRAAIQRAEARERDIVGKIRVSDARREELQQRLNEITGRLRRAQDELDLASARLDRATAELALATDEFEQATAELEDKRMILDARAASLYMLTPAPVVTAMKTAHSVREVLDAGMFADAVVRRDADIAQEVADVAARAETQRARIERVRDSLASDRAKVAKELATIAAVRQEQAVATSAVNAEISKKQRLLRSVRGEIAAHERAIASYKRESASIAAFLRRQQSTQGVTQGGSGYMKWPAQGRLSSGYGYRTHPISGRRSFHAGIDIAAPHGRPILAARSGEVVYAGYRGAYGLIVVIDHGGSIATLYAHASRTFVRSGQRVRTGERIAAIGTTGYSTGPHLHFEVRRRGAPTNPMAWL